MSSLRPFFHSPERQAALALAASAWVGTPFFARAASRGHGVDCVNLAHELLVEAGAIPRLELPPYSLDRAKHTVGSQLLSHLLTAPELAGRFALVAFGREWAPGDLVGMLSGRADHHLAVVLPFAQCIHAVETHGVVRCELDDERLRERVVYVLRPMEVAS